MRLLIRLIITVGANVAALVIATRILPGFSMVPTFPSYLTVALLLTVVNFFLRPILKFFLAPIIFITLGFFSIILNAGLLLLVDKFSPELTIEGLSTVLLGTILISLINGIIHVLSSPLIKK